MVSNFNKRECQSPDMSTQGGQRMTMNEYRQLVSSSMQFSQVGPKKILTSMRGSSISECGDIKTPTSHMPSSPKPGRRYLKASFMPKSPKVTSCRDKITLINPKQNDNYELSMEDTMSDVHQQLMGTDFY